MCRYKPYDHCRYAGAGLLFSDHWCGIYDTASYKRGHAVGTDSGEVSLSVFFFRFPVSDRRRIPLPHWAVLASAAGSCGIS